MKTNEGFVYEILLDKRNKVKPKFQVNEFDRAADLKKTFSKCDTTNCFYNLLNLSEIVIDTIPSYRFDSLPERNNEALLEKTEITMKENKDVMKALN